MCAVFLFTILCIHLIFNGVLSDCDRMKGPLGLTDCVHSPLYSKFQAAVCLPKHMIEVSTSKQKSCRGENTQFCWYLCSATTNHGGLSTCECDPDSKNLEKSDTPNINCYFPSGNFSWFSKCLAKKKDCPSVRETEIKSKELENIADKMSNHGKLWVKAVKSCIQENLVHVLYPQVSTDCEKIKSKIERSTKTCYVESHSKFRYCDLGWDDIFKIDGFFEGFFNQFKNCHWTPYVPPWAKLLLFYLKNSEGKEIDNLAAETGKTLSQSFKWKESGLTFKSVGPNISKETKNSIPIRIHLYSESKNYTEIEKAINSLKVNIISGKMEMLTLKDGTKVRVTRVIGCGDPPCLSNHLFSLQTGLTSFKLPSYFHWHPWDIYEQPRRWKPNLIDSWDRITQDTPIAILLQTMIFYDQQGRPRKPLGINPAARKGFNCVIKGRHFYSKSGSKRRKKRNFSKQAELWENGIVPYEIQPGFSDKMMKAIYDSFIILHDLTCVDFVPHTSPNEPYISLTKGDNTGCFSYVGRWNRRGKQDVNLEDPGCDTTPIVLHELMHALGQEHEQSRSDRDNYIDIVKKNLENPDSIDLAILDTFDRTPYDVESLMQYELTAFSKNGKPTMRLKDSWLNKLVGSAQTLTFYDVKEITWAYNCAANCKNPPQCQNGGFVAHSCQCMCPSGITGNTCNEVKSDRDCGGILDLTVGQQKVIESPNYRNTYRRNKECLWMIRGPTNSNIKLTIQILNLRRNVKTRTCYHWLEIRYNLVGQTGIKSCNALGNQQFLTTNDGNKNIMILKFDSRLSRNEAPLKYQRFYVTTEAVPAEDRPCISKGGKCQESHISCSGSYQENLCGGDATRKCCISSSVSCSSSAAAIACKIIRSRRIKLRTSNPLGVRDGADPYSNIRDACENKPAKRSSISCNAGTSPGGTVCLDLQILNYIYNLGTTNYIAEVIVIAGGCHANTSKHYEGLAADLKLHRKERQKRKKLFMDICSRSGGRSRGERTHVHCEMG